MSKETIKHFAENNVTEINNDLVCAWNEVEESVQSLNFAIDCWDSDKELKEVLTAVRERLLNTMEWLGKYVNDEEVLDDAI